MKRLVLCIFAVCFSIFCLSCYNRILNLESTTQRLDPLDNKYNVATAMRSTVALTKYDSESGEQEFYCTGVFVGPTTIVTARHCVVNEAFYTISELLFEQDLPDDIKEEVILKTKESKFEITTFTSFNKARLQNRSAAETISAQVVYLTMDNFNKQMDPNDLAILKVSPKNSSQYYINVSENDPLVGDRVFTIGMPSGTPWIIAEGIISQEQYYESKKTHNIVNILVAQGMSGGPLIDYKGNLVGISYAMFSFNGERQSNLGIFILSSKILEYLNSVSHEKIRINSINK